MKKEYIVGIDFGHFETSAWVAPINMDMHGEALKLKATNREHEMSYYSMIFSMPDGSFAIDNFQGNIIRGFIDKISVLDQPANAIRRKAFGEYIKQIYKRLIKYNTILKVDKNGNSNFHLGIAYPADWNADEQYSYLNFFNNALKEYGISIMWCINESDAICAPFSMHCKNENKCTLIIGCNQSTTSYTTIYNKEKKHCSSKQCRDCVVELIQKEIEKYDDYQIAKENTFSKASELGVEVDIAKAIKHEIDKALEFGANFESYPYLELHYNLIGKHTNYGRTAEFRAEKNKYNFNIECQVDKVIEPYKRMFAEELNTLKTDTGQHYRKAIDNVIITGAEAKMPWIKEVVNDVFANTNINIEYHIEYGGKFGIAKGIALYIREKMKATKTIRI